jgi:predicted GIY-YIG superfamily endonuclease
MYVVYILRCSDRSLYVGQTNNITRRLREHNAGRGANFTSTRRPVTLAYTETHKTKSAAISRERQLKGWTRRKKEALIRGDFDLLHLLSVRRN